MTSDERNLLVLLARMVVRISDDEINGVEIPLNDIVEIDHIADRIEAAGAAAADEERINDRG